MRRSVLAALAALLPALGACYAWRPSDPRLATRSAASAARAEPVRVTRRDSTIVVVWAPRTAGDSVVGRRGARAGSARVAVALADVARLERQRFDWDRSGLALMAGVAAVPLFGMICYAVCE